MNSPPLSELNLHTGAKALAQEWLSGYFDGASHLLYSSADPLLNSGVVVRETFPLAWLAFDQGPIAAQPLNHSGAAPEVEIRTILDSGNVRNRAIAEGYYSDQRVVFNFWVRAKHEELGAGNANYLANRVADLLVGICNHPTARFPLAQKGVAHLSAALADSFQDEHYVIRLVRAFATLNTTIRF